MKVGVCSERPILHPCSLKNFDYQIDPYIGCEHYCYYCYGLNKAETQWDQEILMHRDIIRQLKNELEGIPPQTIYFGYETDPYQPCEAKYGQTRMCLELLLQNGFSASILTKSDLVLRDIDIFKKMDKASVSISVAFTDDVIRRQFEAQTVDTKVRIDALKKIASEGISTSALICPIIPYLTNVLSLIEQLLVVADRIWIYGLTIQDQRDENWQNFMRILDVNHPQLKKRILPVIFSRDHIYWNDLRQKLLAIDKERNLNLLIHI